MISVKTTCSINYKQKHTVTRFERVTFLPAGSISSRTAASFMFHVTVKEGILLLYSSVPLNQRYPFQLKVHYSLSFETS